MNEFLAPNGKPSNLTPEQYKLVRLPEFKAWFGDWENDPENASKILNENGEPLICFHGTNQDFSTFDEKYIGMSNDRGYYGKGFYFTFQKEIKDFNYSISEAGYYGKKIISCFIKALNPFNISDLSKYKGISINYIGIESIVFLYNISKYFPYLSEIIKIDKNVWNKNTQEYDQEEVPISILPNLIEKYQKELKLVIVEDRWGDRNAKDGYVKSEIVEYDNTNYGGEKGSWIDNDYLGKWEFRIVDGVQYPTDTEIEIGLICEAIKKYNGIDARFHPEGYMTRYPQITDAIKDKYDCVLQGETGDELVVFKPQQIKLADGTNTTFDGNNPDIRFDGGGNVEDDDYYDEYGQYWTNKYLAYYLFSKKKNELKHLEEKNLILSNEEKITFTEKNNQEIIQMKPLGLWYAKGFDWVDWIQNQMTSWSSNYHYLHEIKVTEKVLKIKNKEDAIEFAIEYGHYVKSSFGITEYTKIDSIDWGRVAENWSGIEMVNPRENWKHLLDRRLLWTGSWDVGSGCVWKEDGIDKITLLIDYKDSNNPDIRFADGGDINDNLKQVQVNKTILHKSNPMFRESISKQGLIPKGKSETWLSDTQIEGNVIFATNTSDINNLFDSGYDDDIYRIDTTGLNNKWYLDPNFSWSDDYNHIITFEPIPLSAITLVHEGSGKSLDEYADGGGLTKNQNSMVIKFTENQIDYLSDQVDIMIETYDNDYDDNGILDEAEADYLQYPETISKNRNDLENLKLKILNREGSSYTKIEKDVLISRIDMTLDALYNDSEVAGGKRSLISAQKKLQENNSAYEEGGDTNWNLDRYRQVEKEMFDLYTHGKGNTLEYFKLIKERSILEQAKMNQTENKKQQNKNMESSENFAKGGKVIIQPAEYIKYKKIGIDDKYFIEASKDVGLQGINFDTQSIIKRIDAQFNDMLEKYESYLINEDSQSITNYINNEIERKKEQGSSLEEIKKLEASVNNPNSRRSVIDEIANTQKESLQQWVDYLRESEYPLPFKFLMLKAVLSYNYDLKQNKLFERGNDTIRNFTPFDAGSLAELYEKQSDYLLLDYNTLMNENSNKILSNQEVVEKSGEGKWIKFNGGKKTPPEQINNNGIQLMRLVQNTYWCTKSAGTNQLRGGDFYVYVTELNGEIFPRIAVRMNEDKVGEVRGNKSASQDIDAEMLPIAEKFLIENIPNDSGKKWLDSITFNRKCAEMTKRLRQEGFYKDFIYDYIKIYAGRDKYQVDWGRNGNVTDLLKEFDIQKQNLPNQYYKEEDFEMDYNRLNPYTKYFIGDLTSYAVDKLFNMGMKLDDLKNWQLKLVSGVLDCSNKIIDLGNIEYVGENLILSQNTTDLGKIKYIGNEIQMNRSPINSLKNLEFIGGNLLINSNIKDLGKLTNIGSNLQIDNCDNGFSLGLLEKIDGNLTITTNMVDIDFGNLKVVRGNFNAQKTMITDLKGLESVNGTFNINGSKIKKFEKLRFIGGDAIFSNNFATSTQNIETILGNCQFLNSRIVEFPKLKKIGGTLEFRGSLFKTFGNIKFIGGSLNFADSILEDLGDLEYIGGYASFKGSKIKTLNKLKKIIGFANFESSNVEDLGDLESIGGNAYFRLSKIKSLGKLKYIGGLVWFVKTNYKGLEGNYDVIAEELKK